MDGAQLIAIHAGKYYKRSDGLALGPGCFVKGLEYSAQCKAELVGKPNSAFFESAVNGIPPEEVIMIGDVSVPQKLLHVLSTQCKLSRPWKQKLCLLVLFPWAT